MHAYFDMIREVLTHGTRKENRTGVDTLSTFNFNYELCWDEAMYGRTLQQPQVDRRHIIDMPGQDNAIPMLTTKDVSWKNIVVEMLWFLSGQPSLEILRRHGCKFWDAWADDAGNVPSAYGNFWRRFPTHGVFIDDNLSELGDSMGPPIHNPTVEFNDQIKWVLNELRRNPMSRRLVVSAWAPGNAQKSGLPPCHMLFAFNVQNVEESLESRVRRANDQFMDEVIGGVAPEVREQMIRIALARNPRALDQALRHRGIEPRVEQRLCLHLTQRSADLALGVPYNMASYALLLLIFSHLSGIKPGIFAHTLLDLHIYTSKPDGSMAELDHVPGLKTQLERAPRTLPRLKIDPSIKELSDIEALMGPDVSTEKILEMFKLEGYEPHPAIKFKVAV